jgi:ABC-type phosphonate transport system ATPase subunit
VELERRGVVPFLIVTRTFLPLVQAQAAARKVEPKLVVIDHPVGGLNESELAGRIDEAYAGVAAHFDAAGIDAAGIDAVEER